MADTTISVSERLIQRCVDNELTADERGELLRQLEDAPDGWKTLACTYMEEQLFAAAVVEPDQQAAARLSSALVQPAAGRRHWFNHPLTSAALIIFVAFLTGMLISRGRTPDGDSRVASADSSTQATPDRELASGATPLTEKGATYHVQLEADGNVLRDLPVYKDPQRFVAEYEANRQRVRQSLGRDGNVWDSVEPQISFIRLPTRDGRIILVPVENFPVAPRFH